MIDRKEMGKADRSQTKAEALAVLAKMNAMLRKMPISEAVKKEHFERLQDKLNSFGWLGLCEKKLLLPKPTVAGRSLSLSIPIRMRLAQSHDFKCKIVTFVLFLISWR